MCCEILSVRSTVAASIEARLRAMQRKLSEIAEIPRILSSTLATVSQTFDKLIPADLLQQQHQQQQLERKQPDQLPEEVARRKYSYDEDAVDYELSDDGDDSADAEGSAEARDVAVDFQLKLRPTKELTPESDYASEVNCGEREGEDDDNDGNDDDNDGDDDDDDEMDYQADYDNDHEDDDEHVADETEDEEDDEEDFLTTTYTWNLRNVPKLQLNDTSKDSQQEEDDDDSFDEKEELKGHEQDKYADDFVTKQRKVKPARKVSPSLAPQPELPDEKHDKLDKLERSWPWADREKIIYKQSTCHLVRRRPLGIVEQRIQLLAKQHLWDKHLRKTADPING